MRICGKCGAKLTGLGPAGLCPKCFLQEGLTPVQPDSPPAQEAPVPPVVPQPSPPGPEGPRARTELDRPDLPDEALGTRISHYKLLERVGEGGFGVVYVAEQTEPVRRRVALKVIKLGMDTQQVVARFEAERQALALMDHPNIAKVLDGGSTDSGRPYFVMELVKGIKITHYCDQNRLSTAARLDLFIQVCHAIQHAHQKGIIHRDLKPSNILVTLQDGVPVPKVIDFGIAKATEGRLTDATLYTQLNQFVGTPAYMSPEQAEMSGLDIDTRSDIYSLGVLLYELLAGRTPFDAKELMAQGLAAMVKAIREKEPPRPSTRLATLKGEDLTTTAKCRAMEAPKLISLLRGDLDWIVMKCLEKDRTRRYETANALGADLTRHLTHEPVVARPPSRLYRLRKSVRRNRLAYAAAAAVGGALALGVAFSSWQAVRALQAEKLARQRLVESEEARGEAEAISKFLTGVFQSPDPARDGRTITVTEMLDTAAKKLETELASLPARRVQFLATLGETYYALGLFREAIPLQERARDYYLTNSGPEHTNCLRAMGNLANSYHATGRRNEALKLRQRVLTLCRKLLGPEHPDTLWAMHNIAPSLDDAGRGDEALRMREEVLVLSRRVLGADDPATLRAMNELAANYQTYQHGDEALKLREEALTLSRKTLGPEHPETVRAIGNLAVSYFAAGRLGEAHKLRDEALTLSRKVFGPEHPATLWAMNHLASSYDAAGRRAEALQLREEALRLCGKVLGPKHRDTLSTMEALASSCSRAGRWEEALKLQEEVLARSLEKDPNSLSSAFAYAQLAVSLEAVGRGDDAIKAWQETVRIDPFWQTRDTRYSLGKALVQRQRYAEALPHLRAAQVLFSGNDMHGRELAEWLALAESQAGTGNPPTGAADREFPTAWLTALQRAVAADPADKGKAKHLATFHLWLGQTNEHRAVCRDLLDRAADSQDPGAQDVAAKAYLVHPGPDPEMLKEAVVAGRQARKLASSKSGNWGWFLITAALAALRDGAPAEAEPLLTEALSVSGNHRNCRRLALACRAMARAQLRRTNDAQADFGQLEKIRPVFPAPPSPSAILLHPDVMDAAFLYEEAKALLTRTASSEGGSP